MCPRKGLVNHGRHTQQLKVLGSYGAETLCRAISLPCSCTR